MKQVMPGFFFLFSSLSVYFFSFFCHFCLFVCFFGSLFCLFVFFACLYVYLVCLFYYVDLAMGGDGLISNQKGGGGSIHMGVTHNRTRSLRSSVLLFRFS